MTDLGIVVYACYAMAVVQGLDNRGHLRINPSHSQPAPAWTM